MGSTPSSEEYFEKTVEQSVVAAVLRAAEPDRRQSYNHGLGTASNCRGKCREFWNPSNT